MNNNYRHPNAPVVYDQNHNINNTMQLNSRDLTRVENQAQRYWQLQQNLFNIYQNEHNRYNYFKDSQDNLLRSISFDMIRLWRYKKKFYYRPNQDSDLIIGSKDEIANEISSRFHNINVTIVNDLNDVLASSQVRVDTIYIALNSITVVENEVFEPSNKYDVFQNPNGSFRRNLLHHTSYLFHRFTNYRINNNETSYTQILLRELTQKDTEFIVDWLGAFLKTMQNSSKALVLVDNKDVSIDIFYKHIITPIFGNDFCITITDEILRDKSIEEIVSYKLFYNIQEIPQEENNRKKLRDIINTILVKKVVFIEGKVVPVIGQILFTLDKPELFLKEFLSSCKIFNVDSMHNIQTKLEKEQSSLEAALKEATLDYFSKELSAIGATVDLTKFFSSDSQSFEKYLNALEVDNAQIAKVANQSNILDPFEESFEALIPMQERYTNTYITGNIGSGKSEIVKTLLYRDILRNDGSVILIEPHSDLASQVARLVQDKSRLVYIDATLDKKYTSTINLFDIDNTSEENISKTTQLISSVLKDINDEDKLTGSMTEVLENCISVLLRKGDSDFMELNQFMNDRKNKDLVKLGENSPIYLEQEFFLDYFDSATQTKAAVKRRLRKLLSDPMFSNLMNGKNTVDLEKEMNTKGKVIIIKVPKDEMSYSYIYYARFIIGLIQNIAIKRASLSEVSRVHTHLYIDEFQNFITPTIKTVLTESRKFKLFLTFAHQAVSQIEDTNLRDIILSNTNVKIVGQNSNKTLDAINKTLNTKLEDVEKLNAGEFYISAGTNDIIKIQNSDKLLGDKGAISNEQREEQKKYQLEHYYRPIIAKQVTLKHTEEELDKMINEFIIAIKTKDISYFSKLQDVISKSDYEDFITNFNDTAGSADGYIIQPKLSLYFNALYPEIDDIDNTAMLKKLKDKDDLFKQNVKDNSKYKTDFRYKIIIEK